MPFSTCGDGGAQLRVIADECEPNPSPPVNGRPRAQMSADSGTARAEPRHSRRCTPPPKRAGLTVCRRALRRHPCREASGSGLRAKNAPKRARKQVGFEPEPSGLHQPLRNDAEDRGSPRVYTGRPHGHLWSLSEWRGRVADGNAGQFLQGSNLASWRDNNRSRPPGSALAFVPQAAHGQ